MGIEWARGVGIKFILQLAERCRLTGIPRYQLVCNIWVDYTKIITSLKSTKINFEKMRWFFKSLFEFNKNIFAEHFSLLFNSLPFSHMITFYLDKILLANTTFDWENSRNAKRITSEQFWDVTAKHPAGSVGNSDYFENTSNFWWKFCNGHPLEISLNAL